MNWLNLCSGGEIGRQAVKELGLPVTNWFSSEIDKFAIKVANDNHDDLQHLGDICTVYDYFDKNVTVHPSTIDVILCGSPCQGFSVANIKRSVKDERNFLYLEMLRIIKDKRPKFSGNTHGGASSVSRARLKLSPYGKFELKLNATTFQPTLHSELIYYLKNSVDMSELQPACLS